MPMGASLAARLGALNIASTTASAHGSLRYGAPRNTSP